MSKNSQTDVDMPQIKSWDLPYVADEREVDDSRTNALNRRSEWKYEPPEPEPEIVPPTAEEIEAIRQAAYEEGVAEGKQAGHAEGLQQGHSEGLEQGQKEGFEQGHQQGLASGKEEIQQQITSLQQLLEQLHKPVENMQSQLETELVQLAVSLARAVVRVELCCNKDMIFQALSEGLKVLPINESSYHIHLNPEDIALIRAHFSQEDIDKHQWHFVEAPAMARGGCDISTDSNAVDMSVERRSREVLDKFLLEQGLAQHIPQAD